MLQLGTLAAYGHDRRLVVTNEGTFNVINANTSGHHVDHQLNGGATQFFNGTSASAAIIVNKNNGALNFFNTRYGRVPPISPTATAASTTFSQQQHGRQRDHHQPGHGRRGRTSSTAAMPAMPIIVNNGGLNHIHRSEQL